MRLIAAFLAGSLISTFAHSAEDSPHSALISRIEVQYLASTVVGPDSPIIDQWIAPARTLNPEVDQATWNGVKTDVAAALTSLLTAKGSALEVFFRGALDALSDAELARLSDLLNDPVYKKFQGAMGSTENQKRMLQAFMGDSLSMGAAVNGVLEKHGLKAPR